MSATIKRKIDTRLDTIERRLNRPDLSEAVPELEGEIREDLRTVYREYTRLQQANSFEDWVVKELAGKAEDEDRDEPLCTCGDQLCPVRNGEVPKTRNRRVLTQTVGFRERLNSWKRGHVGDPKALNEAMESYSDQYADILTRLSEVRGKVGRAIRIAASDDGEDRLSPGSHPAASRSTPTVDGEAATDGGAAAEAETDIAEDRIGDGPQADLSEVWGHLLTPDWECLRCGKAFAPEGPKDLDAVREADCEPMDGQE